MRSRIVHLTSAHPRNDVRIVGKQCRSLVEHGFVVTLVVADSLGDERRGGIDIVDVGRAPGRLQRLLHSTRRVAARALALDADLYHFHDPELIPAGLRLKRAGKTVIFDSHEDVTKQLLAKTYLSPAVRGTVSALYARYERHACRRFDGIIAATPAIREKFLAINQRTVDVNNFPRPAEFAHAVPWNQKSEHICYAGNVSAARGIAEMVDACALLRTPVRLRLAGSFAEPALEAAMRGRPGWARVDQLGQLDRVGVCSTLARAKAGLVTLHPVPNHLDALPIKMFEYMAAGIPVIASHFPLWRQIVEGNACGLCVDPLDPRAIAAAIDYLVLHPEMAERMGENGRTAVRGHFNWATESRKLIEFYGYL